MLNITIRDPRNEQAGTKWFLFTIGLAVLMITAIAIDPGASIPATGAEQVLEMVPTVSGA